MAGLIIQHANPNLTVEDGYLPCNGAAVSRTEFANLFAVIGVIWGAGDGSTTFNVPDLRGEFVRGWDAGRGVDAGRGFATQQADNMPGHRHTTGSRASGTCSFSPNNWPYGNSPNAEDTVVWGGTGGSGIQSTVPWNSGDPEQVSGENRPPNFALRHFISI